MYTASRLAGQTLRSRACVLSGLQHRSQNLRFAAAQACDQERDPNASGSSDRRRYWLVGFGAASALGVLWLKSRNHGEDAERGAIRDSTLAWTLSCWLFRKLTL